MAGLNLYADSGYEIGTAVTDIGSPTTSEQSSEQAHSGTYSWKIVADAVDEGFSRTITVVSGKFYRVSTWIYAVTSGTVDFEFTGGILQNGVGTKRTTTLNDAWQKLSCVVRATSTSLVMKHTSNGAQTFYVDDTINSLLTDVSITCTPASLANSTEGTGIRVDGRDTLTQPIPVGKLKATKGRIRFKWTPRHSAADFLKFNNSGYLCRAYGDVNNYFTLYCQAANNIRLYINSSGVGAILVDWNCTGLVIAGNTYLLEIVYTSTKIVLKVDGIIRITVTTPITFANPPTTFYGGTYPSAGSVSDSVISPP